MSSVVTRGLAILLVLTLPFLAGCLGDDAAPAAGADGATDQETDAAAAGGTTSTDPHAHHGASEEMVLAESEWRSVVPQTMLAYETMATVSEFEVPAGLKQLELQIDRRHDGPEVLTAAIEVFLGDQSLAKKDIPGSGASPTGHAGTLTITIEDPKAGAYRIGYHIDTIDRQNEHAVDITALGHMA